MSALRKLTIERRADGSWDMLRELDETGDRWVCDDLMHAFDVVLAAFRQDGTIRAYAPTATSGTAGERSDGE